MSEQAPDPPGRKAPAFAKRKAVSVSQESLVKEELLAPGGVLPIVVTPSVEGLSLLGWAKNNREFIEERLRRHAGLLFRGFEINGQEEFQELMNGLASEGLLEYRYRSTPRSQVAGKVYTSTEYPADHVIPMHNEMSYSRHWPLKIWFYSVKVAAEGGETPVADSRRVFARIDPEVRQRFIDRKVMYVRNYGEGLDLTWQSVFQTEDRSEVEAFCREAGIELEWKGGGRLRTWQVCPGVAVHPRTGETVWFNQAHLFHISSLGEEVRRSLLSSFAPQDLPRNAFFGDGSPIDDEDLDTVRRAYEEESIFFGWQPSDVLMLDNMLVAHGRAPFQGERKVLVGMADEWSSEVAGSKT